MQSHDCAGAGDLGVNGPQYDVFGRPVTDPAREGAADAAENALPLLLARNTPQRSQEERDANNVRARAEQRAWWDSELEKARKETHGGPRPVRCLPCPLAEINATQSWALRTRSLRCLARFGCGFTKRMLCKDPGR